MKDWKKVNLADVVSFAKERIDTGNLSLSNYVSTENMLPGKAGITVAATLPKGNAIRFSIGQTLISNIRPYFKKIWFASRTGGCSADVLVFIPSSQVDAKFLYFLLSQDIFFDYMMAGAKGTKMPRGDKKQIMQFPLLLPPLSEQKAIAETLSCLDDKIANNTAINHHLASPRSATDSSPDISFGSRVSLKSARRRLSA